jgi:Arc/MetJ-type ribon-helix-helix transcriptional regulator
MRAAKQKAVINAEKSQIERVKRLVDDGRYRTVSEFVREAVDEKLERIAESRIAEAVERYCSAGHGEEDVDLVETQALPTGTAAPKRNRRRRAAR